MPKATQLVRCGRVGIFRQRGWEGGGGQGASTDRALLGASLVALHLHTCEGWVGLVSPFTDKEAAL